MDNLGFVIGSASAGRALRGLRMTAMDSQEVGTKMAGNNSVNNQVLTPFVSNHILLELPQAEEHPIIMAPAQAAKSFIACFSSSEESLKFREDVASKGWSAAISLHTGADPLNCVIDLNSDAISSSTNARTSGLQKNISHICFTHCRYVPKKCFQIPASKMRLCKDALNAACEVDSHSAAAKFLDKYHSHVSTGLYHVGGILFHELSIQSEEQSSLQQMLKAAHHEFGGSLEGIFKPLISLFGVEVSGTSSTTHNSASTTASSSKVCKVRETVTTLGPTSHSGDPSDFLRKLEEDSLSWAIIDKQPDKANDLVSVWQIIHQQLPSFTADPTKLEQLRQSARYTSTRWQDDIESKVKLRLEHPIISELFHVNAHFQRDVMASRPAAGNGRFTLSSQSSFRSRIPQLPQKMSLPQLLEQLRKLTSNGSGDCDYATIQPYSLTTCNRAAALIKTYVQHFDPSEESNNTTNDLFKTIGYYGFDKFTGNVLVPLDIPQLHSLISDLEKITLYRPLDGRTNLNEGGRTTTSYEVAEGFIHACHQKYSTWETWTGKDLELTPTNTGSSDASNALLRYAWDVVNDRPFLPSGPPASMNEQAKHLLDCLKHRVDILPHLSRIRGARAMTTKDDSSWSDDEEEELDEEEHVQVSPLDLIIHLLSISDVPTQVAVYALLLEQRAGLPLVHVSTSPLGTSSVPNLQHHVQALSFVDVKLPREKKVIITNDTKLPRVVFASKKRISESRAAIVASKTLCCNFMSQHNRNEMDESPVIEVGLGFLRPGQVQAGQDQGPLPCLAFHINGPLHQHSWLMEFVNHIADVIVLELESHEDMETSGMMSGHEGQAIEMLRWVDDRQDRQDKRKKLIAGGESYIANTTEKFLRHFLRGKLLPLLNQTSDLDRRKTLAEICNYHFHPSDPDLCNFKKQEEVLSALDFASVKQGFCLQESFNRESRMQFELLKFKHSPAETRKKQNDCCDEKKRRAGLVPNAMNNQLVQVLHLILTIPDAASRRVGMMWLGRAIAEKMRPLIKDAVMKKDKALQEWEINFGNTELKGRHMLIKQDYVDQSLGIGTMWRELCHIFDATSIRKLATLAALHLLDAFPLEILDGDAGMFCAEWVKTVLAELDTLTSRELKRPAKICVLSVMGLQSSGKSTLLNLMFGTQLQVSAGRCTRGVYLQVVKSECPEYDYLFLLDTEGIRSPEFHGLDDSQIRDNRLATFGLLPADASIFMVSNEDDSGLKEVLPMVLLAFKGSRIAEKYGNTIRSKMVFVYRSVDTNDQTRLRENKQKLREHLRTAAMQVEEMGLNRKQPTTTTTAGSSSVNMNRDDSNSDDDEDEDSVMMATTSGIFQSMFSEGTHIDEDDSKSDIKCMGNLKRGHTPPDDVPEWEYGKQVIDIREYIHKRVTEDNRWNATTIMEWSNYLTQVWNCICEADFDLSFKTAMERIAYDELQKSLAKGPRLELTKKYMEEFEQVESDVRSKNLAAESRPGRAAVFDINVDVKKKALTRDVQRMLDTKMWRKWKSDELRKWDSFCLTLHNDYKVRLEGFMNGVFEFEKEVCDYERKMKNEIVELIDQGKLDSDKRDGVFHDIFNRIVNEAKAKHELFADRVPHLVWNQYDIIGITRMFQLHSHSLATPSQVLPVDVNDQAPSWPTSVGQSIKQKVTTWMHPDNGRQRGTEHQQQMMWRKLEDIVVSNVQKVKEYNDVIVMKVIRSTTAVLGDYSRDVQEKGHCFVMDSLIKRLHEKQMEWDKKHNVAERLKEAEPRLRGFFEDYANGVGAADMVISELKHLLEAQLPDAQHELLVRVVVDNLANKNWMIDPEALKACLDLDLLILMKKEMFQLLFTCARMGGLHFQVVTDALIAHECQRLYKTEKNAFIRKVTRCLQDAGEKARQTGKKMSFVDVFMNELKHMLQDSGVDHSAKLATSMSSRISCEQYKDLDVEVFTKKVPELCRSLEQTFCNQVLLPATNSTGARKLRVELVGKVRERMRELREERLTMRCHETCPLCGITCMLGEGHAGCHDTVHQPQGLAGLVWEGTGALAESSCWRSFEAGDRMVRGASRRVPYKDFNKEFPTWCNPSNRSPDSIRVREYIFFNYQTLLVAHFKEWSRKVLKCPPYKMPKEYDHLRDSLWNAIHNKLGDTFTQIEPILQDIHK